ncbi:Yip1 family protein [Natrialbaceae archaeon A-arb3/5]
MTLPSLRSLRTFILSPTTFFDERPPAETLLIAAGIVVVFAVCLAGAVVLFGSILAGSVDATVTMDNPDRPPEWVCNQHGDDPDSILAENCDEPETIDRDAGALLQEEIQGYAIVALVSPFVLWLVGGIVLFAAGRLAGGTPTVPGSFALAGWAAVPEFARLAAVLVGFWYVFRNVTITDPESEAAVLENAIASLDPILLILSLLTLAWQWYLLAGGLSREANVSWPSAAVAVGIPLAIFGVFSVF